MRIVLFRHGPAGRRDDRRWPDDGLRPLTPRGKERTEQAARGLARALALTRIVTSPLVRATQSADVTANADSPTNFSVVADNAAIVGYRYAKIE